MVDVSNNSSLKMPLRHWLLANYWYRKVTEALAWILLITLLWSFDLQTKFDDRMRFGLELDDFRLIAEQITSGLAVAIMLIYLQFWTRWFIPTTSRMLYFAVGLVTGSLLFVFGHYSLMVMFRAIIYPWFGEQFVFTNVWGNLWFEYRKDIKIYLVACLIMWLYRQWLHAIEKVSIPADENPTITIDTGTSQRCVQLSDVSHFEAAKNYVVVVMINGQEGLLRDTLTNLENMTSDHQFLRVHRSYVVNLKHVDALTKASGQTNLVTHSDIQLPVSRTYRNALQKKLNTLRVL